MYRKNPCGLGIIAPIGLTVMPTRNKYVEPGINLGSYCAIGNIPTDAWRSRIVPPRNLYSSIGATNIVTTEQQEEAEKSGGWWDGLVERVPGWFGMLKDAAYGQQPITDVPPEDSDTPDVTAMDVAPPSFIDKYGKIMLFGALGVGAYLMMKKKA